MSWNYRLVRHKVSKNDGFWFAVHEVYYDKSGKAYAITKDAITIGGDTPEEVTSQLVMVRADVKRRPILDYESVPEKGAKAP